MRRGSISRSSSSSSRSSSRMSRSSRRHHHRHRYYRGSIRSRLIGIAIIIIILLAYGYFAITWNIADTKGRVDTTYISLEPGQTMMVDSNAFWDVESELSIDEGIISGYYFDEEPSLTNKKSYTINDQISVSGETSEYIYFYANKGSTLTGSFTVSTVAYTYSTFGLYHAKSGDGTEDDIGSMIKNFDQSTSIQHTFDSSDGYYLLIESRSFITETYKLDLVLNTQNHDLSDPVSELDSFNNIPQSKNGANVLILANEADMVVNGKLDTNPRFNTAILFLAIQFILFGGILTIVVRSKSSDHQRQSNFEEDTQLIKSDDGYYQRPKPRYCPNCGSLTRGKIPCPICGYQ